MKIKSGFILSMFCIGILVSCGNLTNSSLNDQIEPPLFPTPEITVQSNDKDKIKADGWQTPNFKDKKRTRIETVNMSSEEGKNENVTVEYYTPTKKFTYIEKPFDEAKSNFVEGELELVSFIEFKLKGKVFLYTIFAKKIDAEIIPNNNAYHKSVFVYQIIDKNGDGKFETLLGADSKIFVPNWVLD